MSEPVGDDDDPDWHNFMTMDGEGDVTSMHHVPMEQFVHTCAPDATCLCGPSMTMNFIRGDLIPMVTHNALSAAFYSGPPDQYDFI